MYDEILTEITEVLDRALDTKPFNDTLSEVPEASTTIRIISGIVKQAKARLVREKGAIRIISDEEARTN